MTDLVIHELKMARGTARRPQSLRLRRGNDRLEVRSDANRYLGLYNGILSVSAPEPHIALQMLIRRHIKLNRDASHV